MSSLSTHVLDTASGHPAAGVRVVLRQGDTVLADGETDADGRLRAFPELSAGRYALAFHVADYFRKAGMAVVTDTANSKIQAKIREHSVNHVPVIAVVGRKEAEQRTVALRRLGSDGQTVLPLEDAVALLALEAMPPDLARINPVD